MNREYDPITDLLKREEYYKKYPKGTKFSTTFLYVKVENGFEVVFSKLEDVAEAGKEFIDGFVSLTDFLDHGSKMCEPTYVNDNVDYRGEHLQIERKQTLHDFLSENEGKILFDYICSGGYVEI